MALKDYNEVFQIDKKKLFVAVCIYNQMEYATKSPVNRMLSDIVEGLKKELPDYESIYIAYVYETDGLMEVKPMRQLTTDSSAWFKEPYKNIDRHNLEQIFYMGMALLKEEKQKKENAEYRLCLVTDEKFSRADKVLFKTGGAETINPAFADVNPGIFLYKSENAGGEALEDFVNRTLIGKVITYKQ